MNAFRHMMRQTVVLALIGLLLLLLLALLAVPPAHARDIAHEPATAFVGVFLIPMDTERVLENQTVVVEDGVITAVGASDHVKVPKGARVIDGEGRYLMPGLLDLHVHVGRTDDYLNYLNWGVTTIMHLGGSGARGQEVLEDRKKISAGKMIGPTIYATRYMLDGDPPTGGNQYPLATPEAARKAVTATKADGFDFIKIYNEVPLEIFTAIVEEADRQNLSVFGHIPRRFDALVALSSGQDAVVHSEEFFFTYFQGPRDQKDVDRGYRPGLSKIPPLIDVLVKNDVAVMPDLCFTFTDLIMWDDLDLIWNDPEMTYLHPNEAAEWVGGSINRREAIEGFVFRERIKYELILELTQAFQKAGVLQVIGTDAALPGLFPGKSAHRELTELVKAGLSNFEVLSIGTRNGGAFLQRYIDDDIRVGQIAKGYRADLVLVDDNPLEDVRNARHIRGVMTAGRWYSRDDLDAERGQLAVAYEAINNLNATVDAALEGSDAEETLREILDGAQGDAERTAMIQEHIASAGMAAANGGDIERCQEIFALATRLFPDSAEVWYLLGRITYYTDGPEKAAELYRKALSLDPDHGDAKEYLQKAENE